MIKTDSKRKCIICGEDKEFIDIDYLRLKPCGMKVCLKCGFIFNDKFYDEQEQEAYYEENYRPVIHAGHLVTANRKIGILEVTLGEYLKKEKNLKICDVGAGIGYMLRWARDKYGHKQVLGSEYSILTRRFAKNSFNIDLTKDFDDSQKYDFICMNHVLEHTIDPAKELAMMKGCLTSKGRIFLSTPLWMNNVSFAELGEPTEFDGYFQEDHINCWTKNHLKQLINNVGYEIEKEWDIHGVSFILAPMSPLKEITQLPFNFRNGRETEIELLDIKRAIEAYKKLNFREAIRLYPKLIDAYVGEAGMAQGKFDLQMKIIGAGIGQCPNSNVLKTNKASLLFQYGRMEEAQAIFLDCLKTHPHDENVLFQIAMIHFKYGEKCYKENKTDEGRKNWQECLKLFAAILNINPGHHQELYNYIGYIYANRILTGEELKDESPKFEAPKGKNAPEIDLGIK